MKDFELLDIATADMAFAAYGRDLAGMFANAGRALTSIMFEPDNVEGKTEKRLSLSAPDTETLLHDFLHEVLLLFEDARFIGHEFRVKTDGRKLEAEVSGERYDPKRHKFIIDVKAITYHNMEIKKCDGIWRCQVVVDV